MPDFAEKCLIELDRNFARLKVDSLSELEQPGAFRHSHPETLEVFFSGSVVE
jgi:hypothetical protein